MPTQTTTDRTDTILVYGDPTPAGCYVDGHWGQYGPDRLAQIADGVLGTTFYDALTDARESDDWDAFFDVADATLDALNAATVGGVWAWEDGEVFLVGERTCTACDEPYGDFHDDTVADGAWLCEVCYLDAAHPTTS